MVWQSRQMLILLSFILTQVACVGPTTPFGALNDTKEVSADRGLAQDQSVYKIKFHPEKQVLHDKSDFSIEVTSSQAFSDGVQVLVFHNNIDVTSTFLENSHLHKSDDNKTLIYIVKNLRLKTLDHNKIKVQVVDSAKKVLEARSYTQPDCSMFAKRKLAHLGSFHAPKNFIALIEKVAESKETNPSFLAGVVAQESGFDPKAVSWAKAIGLTQMTPLAEEQVMASIEEWPRYPGINSLSYLTLKSKIYIGEIDHGKEWRLDPEMSLQGGMTYFRYLQKYWNLEQNKKLVDELNGDRDKVLTELILASYNSGASRVKRAVQLHKDNWKEHKSLEEAAKYIKKVSSYCFHYTDKDV